eukprot:212426-Chlamydomonas_euryale.AAC.2
MHTHTHTRQAAQCATPCVPHVACHTLCATHRVPHIACHTSLPPPATPCSPLASTIMLYTCIHTHAPAIPSPTSYPPMAPQQHGPTPQRHMAARSSPPEDCLTGRNPPGHDPPACNPPGGGEPAASGQAAGNQVAGGQAPGGQAAVRRPASHQRATHQTAGGKATYVVAPSTRPARTRINSLDRL